VLGALLEKAFTTPEQYPLTLKALTAACSQKSNRDPLRSYTEDEVESALQDLQGQGLVAEVHTDGGRTPRYRHLVRKRFALTEPQFAILTELWLRGRQQMGELRTRASRMAAIESQEDLRAALEPLLAEGYVRASGPLERRGVEVDHGFYPDDEPAPELTAAAEDDARRDHVAARGAAAAEPSLRDEVRRLIDRVEKLESRLDRLEGA
jgi:uncharacterized protein YceH (UPF0502 family)